MAAYNIAFGGNNLNYASAVAVTPAIATFILSFSFYEAHAAGVNQ